MSKSAAARGSFSAWAALSYERVIPQVNGSLRMNFIAFGFGVGSMSAILGISAMGNVERSLEKACSEAAMRECHRSMWHQATPPGVDSCIGSSSDSVDVLA